MQFLIDEIKRINPGCFFVKLKYTKTTKGKPQPNWNCY